MDHIVKLFSSFVFRSNKR